MGMGGSKLAPVIRQMVIVFMTVTFLLTIISLSRNQGSKAIIPHPRAQVDSSADTLEEDYITDDDNDDDDNSKEQGWDKPIRNITHMQNTVLDYQQLREFEQRFIERSRTMNHVCKVNEGYINSPVDCKSHTAQHNFKYVEIAHLTYCQVPKTGCTLWKRILHVMGGWGNTSNPLDIRSDLASDKKGGFQTLAKMNISDLENIFQTSTNIMFVRDPYTRIFSAWLDKFYTPNVAFWNKTGHEIIARFRPASTFRQECATDISFEEFVRFVSEKVKNVECLDSHFTPSYQHCWQCETPFNYQYIGKFETIEQDVFYLLNKQNMTQTVMFSNFQKDYTYDAIFDLIHWLYTQKDKIQQCGVTFRCTLFTTWKRLQSRGLIGKQCEFPYKTDEEVNSLAVDTVVSEMLDANKRGNQTEMLLQRVEALVQAFRLLSKHTLNEFKEAFKLDFEMFGYDMEPSYLHVEETKVDTFDFFESCDNI